MTTMILIVCAFLLFIFICYIGVISLDKAIYKMKKKKKKKDVYISRRQRMREYNKRR